MKILLVDDEPQIITGLEEALRDCGHEILTASNGETALSRVTDADLMVTDLFMPGMDGLTLLRRVLERRPGLPVLVMTGQGSVSTAVEAMRIGARSYLCKPFEMEELLCHVRDADEIVKLRRDQRAAGRGGLTGSSPVMRKVYDQIDLAAGSDAAVLISGETGTGKELASRAIHDLSARSRGPFLAVNLGAVPRDLVESELFGHEAGAFTGARGARRGVFALASRGTIFLDEIHAFPLDLQPKLLRAIETKEIWPLGATRSVPVDLRVVAATNISIETPAGRDALREDLYYRLHVLDVHLPPLRERVADIPLIVRALLDRIAGPAAATLDVDGEALAWLMAQNWPGNVRELSNVLARAAAQVGVETTGTKGEKTSTLRLHHVASEVGQAPTLPFRKARARVADQWAEQTIRAAYTRNSGNISAAARELGMARFALQRLLVKYRVRAS